MFTQTNITTKTTKGFVMLAAMTALSGVTVVPAWAQYVTPTPAVATMPVMEGSVADLVDTISRAVVNVVVRSESGQVTSEGQGSGFIISPEGEIVTNYHVIDGGTKISVVFNNGTEFKARVLGTDEETDLALLKIDYPQALPSVSFHQGEPVRIGDWVIAIGNPFGIGQSTSLGIVSAIGRDRVESGSFVDYIQTDATINQGNSGGPLFNPQGRVIGVNSAIFSPTGASVGIGFSIPHETAEAVVAELRQHGKVRRAWLGAGLRTAEYSKGSGAAKFNSGAIVNNVVPGGPAANHGLVVDDVILEVNGKPVANSVEATRMIAASRPGETLKLLFERNEQNYTLDLVIGERPGKEVVERARAGGSATAMAAPAPRSAAPLPYGHNNNGAPSRPSDLQQTGLSLVDLSSTFREAIGMRHDQTGVYVESVRPGSPGEGSGAAANTVLLEANSEPITSVRNFRDLIAKAKRAQQSTLLLKVRGIDGSENYLSLPI